MYNLSFVTGMVFNRGEFLGKMGYSVLIARFLPSGTGLTNSKLRTRLGVSFTSRLSIFKGPRVVTVDLLLPIEILLHFPLQPQTGI